MKEINAAIAYVLKSHITIIVLLLITAALIIVVQIVKHIQYKEMCIEQMRQAIGRREEDE